MTAPLNTILIYARNPAVTSAFYKDYFGFRTTGEVDDGLIELNAPDAGINLLIHQAAKSLKFGQAVVKLMFSVSDVEKFKADSAQRGLEFGGTHQANGYQFANAKDPDGNSVSISSREYRQRA
ncbi:VOC family protein [Herbaspirillum seropedicae]|uniref:VOC family protein n=1 Tax=Herbaspirillum seropedicae TaxID=964 RepID=UPI0009D77A83|nr:VOC family protein [Herbaspirillum seropedicae]UMU20458.1 VOC family protein [Herbaspirillum seropedicae]